MTTTEKTFSSWHLIGQSWQIMKKNVWQILGLQIGFGLLYVAILSSIDLLFPAKAQTAWYYQAANLIATIVAHVCFSLGVVTLSLQFADQVSVKWKDFFSKIYLAVPFFVASLINDALTVIGLLCLLIPGVFIFLRFSLFGYFMIDKSMGPIEALQQSWYLVKGVTWRVLGFWLVVLLLMLLGFLCLGVGLLFTLPVTTIASALMYRTLLKDTP